MRSKRHINTDRGEKCQLLFFICHINNFPSMYETDCGWPMRLKFQLWNSLLLCNSFVRLLPPPLFPYLFLVYVRACCVYTCVYIFTHQYLQVTWLAWAYARRWIHSERVSMSFFFFFLFYFNEETHSTRMKQRIMNIEHICIYENVAS